MLFASTVFFCCFEVFSDKELYGLPGGDQVDGLPPAASCLRGGSKNDDFLKKK